MKRTILSALAATMLAATSFGATAAPISMQPSAQAQVQMVDYKPGKTVVKKRVVRRDGRVTRRVVTKRWERGHRVPEWRRYRDVDYRNYGLKRPGRGYRWVRVDNDFLLVSVAGGVIASIIAAQ